MLAIQHDYGLGCAAASAKTKKGVCVFIEHLLRNRVLVVHHAANGALGFLKQSWLEPQLPHVFAQLVGYLGNRERSKAK